MASARSSCCRASSYRPRFVRSAPTSISARATRGCPGPRAFSDSARARACCGPRARQGGARGRRGAARELGPRGGGGGGPRPAPRGALRARGRVGGVGGGGGQSRGLGALDLLSQGEGQSGRVPVKTPVRA